MPYGWQFKNEDVAIEVSRGKALNCFGLISRESALHFATTTQKITADFVLEQLDRFSWHIIKPTVIVLDNAKIHTAKKIKERLKYWQKRGLYIFYLPPYSPHLNICERLWKELKARWIKPEDYKNADTLFYQVKQVLNSVGKELIINFSEFNF